MKGGAQERLTEREVKAKLSGLPGASGTPRIEKGRKKVTLIGFDEEGSSFYSPFRFLKKRVDGAFIFFVAKEKSDRSSSMNHDWPSKSLFDDAPIFQIHL